VLSPFVSSAGVPGLHYPNALPRFGLLNRTACLREGLPGGVYSAYVQLSVDTCRFSRPLVDASNAALGLETNLIDTIGQCSCFNATEPIEGSLATAFQ
jgi:hypothetical protein